MSLSLEPLLSLEPVILSYLVFLIRPVGHGPWLLGSPPKKPGVLPPAKGGVGEEAGGPVGWRLGAAA